MSHDVESDVRCKDCFSLKVEAKARLAEVRFHTRTNQQLKAQLDGIMAQKES